ncbi:NTP transferase domain-containing protein [Streptomyces sp. SM11]|uniref:nucleotidyltransferase family protein n=1 Tax=Streptomyces sp. SM11 TaxID=565557 RepID=UPI002156247D|nr:nucleotidyltransferase family protein [Streptomyces sp. SM11]
MVKDTTTNTATGTAATTPSASENPEVAGVLLAAGGGRRLGGRPKALLEHRGRPLIEHAVRSLRNGGCGPLHVVLGAAADEVRARADLTGCAVTVNPGWEEGMGSSLRLGLAALSASDADAALVLLVDQPGIGAEAVARVRLAYRSRATLAAASYGGERGHPVLFGADRWTDIAAGAVGDQGARAYLREHRDAITLVECSDVAEAYDIDTPRDLKHLE